MKISSWDRVGTSSKRRIRRRSIFGGLEVRTTRLGRVEQLEDRTLLAVTTLGNPSPAHSLPDLGSVDSLNASNVETITATSVTTRQLISPSKLQSGEPRAENTEQIEPTTLVDLETGKVTAIGTVQTVAAKVGNIKQWVTDEDQLDPTSELNLDTGEVTQVDPIGVTEVTDVEMVNHPVGLPANERQAEPTTETNLTTGKTEEVGVSDTMFIDDVDLVTRSVTGQIAQGVNETGRGGDVTDFGVGRSSPNPVVYSHTNAGTGFGSLAAASGLIGQEDYNSVHEGPINLQSFRFRGQLTADQAGNDLQIEFWDSTNSTFMVGYAIDVPAGGFQFFSVGVALEIVGQIPDQGVIRMYALGSAQARWSGTTASPTVGHEDRPGFGTLSSQVPPRAHLFEITARATVDGVAFEHVAQGGGFAAFSQSTGQLGQEDYVTSMANSINLTEFRFLGALPVDQSGADFQVDIFDKTNTIQWASFTMDVASTTVNAVANFVASDLTGLTIPHQGVIRISALGSAEGRWVGSDAAVTVGIEDRAGFGTLSTQSPPQAHNFALTSSPPVNPVVYSHTNAGTGFGSLAAASGLIGQEDYDSVHEGPINLRSFRFRGQVTADQAGNDLQIEFWDSTNSTFMVGYAIDVPAGGFQFFSVGVALEIVGQIPDQGVIRMYALGSAQARWSGTTASPTVGHEDRPGFGTLSSQVPPRAHLFEITARATVDGVAFEHVAQGGGFAAFSQSTGQLGQEDYVTSMANSINLTEFRFLGALPVDQSGADFQVDIFDKTNTIQWASFTMDVASTTVNAVANFVASDLTGLTIPHQGVIRISALGSAEGRWVGSDAAVTVGIEDRAGFGTLSTQSPPQAHNFAMTNTPTDQMNRDYGDAPAPYPTLEANSGAVHRTNGLFLGAIVDGEDDGQPEFAAAGDDSLMTGDNDEDGVVFNDYFDVGTTVAADVTASMAGGFLNAWVDWNQNGSWLDAGEQIFVDMALAAGNNALSIMVPAGAALGRTYARFRLSTETGLAPTGEANDGEVEDHSIIVEDRVSPATEGTRTLVWVNRGETSDRMVDVFGGANANFARGVMDATLKSWEQVIGNFNQPSGGTTIDITIAMAPVSPTSNNNGGGANVSAYDNGFPTSGALTMNRGTDNQGAGWFLDTTPFDHSEFQGSLTGGAFVPFAQTGSPAAGLGDFYTVANAEILHVIGLFLAPALMNNPVNGTVTDTGIVDDSEGGGLGNFWVFDGPSVTHLMTSNNSGPMGNDFGQVVHTAGPPIGPNSPVAFNSAFRGNLQLSGADGPGNAIYSFGQRTLANDVMALILKDAYGYEITLPQEFGTTYAMLEEATGRLLVRGGVGNSADDFRFSIEGSKLKVSVDIGDDIAGTGPNGDASDIGAFTSFFPLDDIESIVIQAGDGSDKITVGPLPGIPINIDGGSPPFPNGNGDSLVLDYTNLTGVNLVNNGNGTGSLSSSGNSQVTWSNIENLVDALIVKIDAESINESDGAAATTATVSRNTDTTNPLTVTLQSSDTSEATVMGSVTIPAGQSTSAPFAIDAVNDGIDGDGTQLVNINASAAAHEDGNDTVDVIDDGGSGGIGTAEFAKSGYSAGETASVKVVDADLAGAGSINVIVISSANDSETVSLTETLPGEFEGTVATLDAATPVVGNGLLDVSAGQTMGVIYDDANSGGGIPAVVTSVVDILQTFSFEADFSDNVGDPHPDGFTTFGPANEWHLSTGRGNDPGHSADDSFYFGSGEGPNGGGSHSNFADGTLLSPPMDLSDAVSAELTFNHLLESEETFDFATVSVNSLSGGGTTVIATSGSELPVATVGFEQATFDLTPFVGQSIQLAFQFTSDVSVTNEGWYIDDVVVRAALPAAELVGVDLDGSGGGAPVNWTTASGPATLTDLIDETGTATPFDLSITSTSTPSSDSATPPSDLLPIHKQSLSAVDNSLYLDSAGSWEFTYSDLVAGVAYEVYLLGLDAVNTVNDVTISGAGAPIVFQQSFLGGELAINDSLGDDRRLLGSFARVAIADASGQIIVTVADTATGDAGLGGIAIRENRSQSSVVTCDFDTDADCDIDDIDALIMAIVAGTNDLQYDITNDGNVDNDDRDQWLADAGAMNLPSGNPYLLGDANLDGFVNGPDFVIWNDNKFTTTGKWSLGDWNASGETNGPDFVIWNNNKFQSSDGVSSPLLPPAVTTERVRHSVHDWLLAELDETDDETTENSSLLDLVAELTNR